MSRDVELANAVMRDREWTTRVVVAALRSLRVLEGPSPTSDGDNPTMVARTSLRAAFLNEDELRDALERR